MKKLAPKPLLLAAGLLLLAAAGTVLLLLAERWQPRDPYNRTVGLEKLRSNVLGTAGLSDVGVCRCAPDRELTLEQAGGFRTRASVFEPGAFEQGPFEQESPGPHPAVVLIHGNTVLGRKLSTYRALASRLAAEGFVVLSFDQLGFGDSDDPFGRGPEGTADAYTRTHMVRAAIDHLGTRPDVRADDVTVIGHSGGAITALQSGLRIDEIGSMILIGPPRRVYERSEDAEDRSYFARRFLESYRYVYGRELPSWVTPEMLADGPWALEDYLAPLTTPGHKPVMLVDGEREPEEEKVYLERFHARLAEPKEFVRLHRSDHYCNTAQSLGLVFYDQKVMSQLVGEITSWLRSTTH